MEITKKELYRGCLIASISHAIMTNIYPELAYEQSWDGRNYSIQDSQGLRGTITFETDYCVGAFRNDNSIFARNADYPDIILSDFPLNIIDIARKETLQYLIIENAGRVFPSVSSIFWADDTAFYYSKKNIVSLQHDLLLIDKILLPEDEAIKEWQKYYDMNNDSIELLKYLLLEKDSHFEHNIVLSEERVQLIPGNQLLNECVESLGELRITVPFKKCK